MICEKGKSVLRLQPGSSSGSRKRESNDLPLVKTKIPSSAFRSLGCLLTLSWADVQDKAAKVSYLTKIIDVVGIASGNFVPAKPLKVRASNQSSPSAPL